MKLLINNINQEKEFESGITIADILKSLDINEKFLVPAYNDQVISWTDKITEDGTIDREKIKAEYA